MLSWSVKAQPATFRYLGRKPSTGQTDCWLPIHFWGAAFCTGISGYGNQADETTEKESQQNASHCLTETKLQSYNTRKTWRIFNIQKKLHCPTHLHTSEHFGVALFIYKRDIIPSLLGSCITHTVTGHRHKSAIRGKHGFAVNLSILMIHFWESLSYVSSQKLGERNVSNII